MSLKTKLANKPIVDKDGFASGVLKNITFIDASDTEFDREQFQFSFKVEGTRKATTINLWTGTTISGEKYDNGTSIDYSKLSKIVLKLGLITEKELIEAYQTGDDPEVDLESSIGANVKFKLAKSVKKRGLSQIDLDTLTLVKASK